MNPIEQPKGKIEIMKDVNADKKAYAENTLVVAPKIMDKTVATFETKTPEVPKEKLNHMPELKLKEVEKSPMIAKLQEQKAAYDKSIITKDWEGNVL